MEIEGESCLKHLSCLISFDFARCSEAAGGVMGFWVIITWKDFSKEAYKSCSFLVYPQDTDFRSTVDVLLSFYVSMISFATGAEREVSTSK